MIIINSIELLEKQLNEYRQQGKSIGFVPTMGALHTGHISLVERCKSENDITVVSIYVNPRQFNNQSDFKLYPRNTHSDKQLLESAHCDVVFLPSDEEMYPVHYKATEIPHIEIDNLWEGYYRPGHFSGVRQVVERLFRIVTPTRAYFGLKDFQQVKVIKHMVGFLNLPVKIIECPVLRDKSGLAKSSRNQRLSDQGLMMAGNIYKVLSKLQAQICARDKRFSNENWNALRNEYIEELLHEGVETEYLACCHVESLKAVDFENLEYTEDMVLLFAGYVEKVRLIDAFELKCHS